MLIRANVIARSAATRQPAAGVPSVSEGSQDRFVGLCFLAITGVSARNATLAMTSPFSGIGAISSSLHANLSNPLVHCRGFESRPLRHRKTPAPLGAGFFLPGWTGREPELNGVEPHFRFRIKWGRTAFSIPRWLTRLGHSNRKCGSTPFNSRL